MGWTYQHATIYKRNGKVDRKAMCDSYAEQNSTDGNGNITVEREVLKSSMVGTDYYAAVKTHKIRTDEVSVEALVMLTEIDNDDYHNFGYKAMPESMGPAAYKCPAGVLNLLTPTDSEFANEWREENRKIREFRNAVNRFKRKLTIGETGRLTRDTIQHNFKYGKRTKTIADCIDFENNIYFNVEDMAKGYYTNIVFDSKETQNEFEELLNLA